MKVAITSASFDAPLRTGATTQLEWLEACASAAGADGVVFEAAHFPRTDGEYLAQLRKIAVDLGLVIVAVSDAAVFDPARDGAPRTAAIGIAAALGAPFVLATLPPPGNVPPATFVATVGAAKAAARAAKAANVTLLVQPAPGTLAEDAAGARHLIKDVDSAWLRFALGALEAAELRDGRDRILIVTIPADADLASVAAVDEAARPWLLLEGPPDPLRVGALRRVAAERLLTPGTARL